MHNSWAKHYQMLSALTSLCPWPWHYDLPWPYQPCCSQTHLVQIRTRIICGKVLCLSQILNPKQKTHHAEKCTYFLRACITCYWKKWQHFIKHLYTLGKQSLKWGFRESSCSWLFGILVCQNHFNVNIYQFWMHCNETLYIFSVSRVDVFRIFVMLLSSHFAELCAPRHLY